MKTSAAFASFFVLSLAAPALGAVPAEEAAALKTTLTPFGAEKAGNADGSIPAWSGGLTLSDPAFKQGDRRKDLFPQDKPLFSIDGKNADQYKDKLPESMVLLLHKYDDTRIDVYVTRRTAAAPQWVYDNTFKNATAAQTGQGGLSLEGAFGGIPFPVPKSAHEVMWNHMLGWRGRAWHTDADIWYSQNGKKVLASTAHIDYEMPLYLEDGDGRKNQFYWVIRQEISAPPVRAGEALISKEPLDYVETGNKAWVYVTGQRRVRALPIACCDAATPASAGITNFDEVQGWSGTMERYTWSIVGKKEMYIPYNTTKIMDPHSSDEILGKYYFNPDYLRWELHRVWVIEADLAPGKRHIKPKRRFYLDEDTWQVVQSDNWDARGQLWTNGYMLTYPAPDLPGVVRYTFGAVDLINGSYIANNVANNYDVGLFFQEPKGAGHFTPDSLAGDGIR